MNKKYLLNTHVCLWAFSGPSKLSAVVKSIIEDAGNSLYLSQTSLFEIAIKININKLPYFNISLDEFIKHITAIGYKILSIKNEHLTTYPAFPFYPEHKEPFDRLLTATSVFEQIPFIIKDEKFSLNKDFIEIIW